MTDKSWFKLDKKILVHHMDVDGSCSSSLFLKVLDFDKLALKDPHLSQVDIDTIISKKPELIIFLDLSIDQDLEGVLKLKKGLPKTKIIVLDHHVIHNDLNKHGMVHINPRFKDKEAYVPTSLLAFQFLEDLGYDMEDHMWISCIGTIADYGHKTNKEFMDRCEKKYSKYLIAKDIFESDFGKATKTIYAAIVYKGYYGTGYVIKILNKSKDFEEFRQDKTLIEWEKAVEKEINRVMKDFESKKEIKGKLVFYNLDSVLGLTSIISNLVLNKYPNKVVVIAKKADDGWKISSRAPNVDVDLSILMNESSKGIGRGGGHKQAAGAFVTDLEKFKKRLLDHLNS